MEDIAFAIVTCSVEPTRDAAFDKVADNILSLPEWESMKDSTIVFDNGSNQPLTMSRLEQFQHVVRSKENVGYWSAVNWISKNYTKFMDEKKYIYIIESDCIHWSMDKISLCAQFLDKNPDIGMVRTQEFLVGESHRFDKSRNLPDSTKWTKYRMTNSFTGESVRFWDPDGEIYKTNFIPVLCGLNRTEAISKVFDNLVKTKNITEVDFQREMISLYKDNAQLDGGIFNTSAGEGAIAGCRIQSIPSGVPYKASGNDTIVEGFEVKTFGEKNG